MLHDEIENGAAGRYFLKVLSRFRDEIKKRKRKSRRGDSTSRVRLFSLFLFLLVVSASRISTRARPFSRARATTIPVFRRKTGSWDGILERILALHRTIFNSHSLSLSLEHFSKSTGRPAERTPRRTRAEFCINTRYILA